MLSVRYMFETEVINEGIYSDTKEALSKYFNMKSVKDFIDLSKKVVKDGVESLNEKEQKTYRGLFEDPAIKDYIAAARRAGERDGWIRGISLGGIVGGVAGAVAGGESVAAAIALAVLGAAAGGAALGLGLSKALSWIRKWKAEDDVIKLGKVGGVIGKTTPIVRAD
jgi:hypothetical protein